MRFLLPATLLFAALFPAAVHAQTSGYSGSGGGFSGSGTLTTTSNGDGSYTIVGISGTGVTGLLDPQQFNGNDNQLFPSASTLVDASGIAFTDTQGDTDFDVNIFSNPDGSYSAFLDDSDGFSETLSITFAVDDMPAQVALPAFHSLFSPLDVSATETFSFDISTASPAATPEPSSLFLLGTGLLAACGAFRRRIRA